MPFRRRKRFKDEIFSRMPNRARASPREFLRVGQSGPPGVESEARPWDPYRSLPAAWPGPRCLPAGQGPGLEVSAVRSDGSLAGRCAHGVPMAGMNRQERGERRPELYCAERLNALLR
jgi:hypothetical protein